MNEIKVRDEVIITNLQENKYHGIVVNINNYREPSMKYAVNIDGLEFDDVVFVGEEQIEKGGHQNANTTN